MLRSKIWFEYRWKYLIQVSIQNSFSNEWFVRGGSELPNFKLKRHKWKFVFIFGIVFALSSDWGGYTLYTREPFKQKTKWRDENQGNTNTLKISSSMIYLATQV